MVRRGTNLVRRMALRMALFEYRRENVGAEENKA